MLDHLILFQLQDFQLHLDLLFNGNIVRMLEQHGQMPEQLLEHIQIIQQLRLV
jgi:hypothetical protein